MKVRCIVVIAMLSTSNAYAGDNYTCEYQTNENGKKTKLSFSLPNPVKFGLLIPVKIRTENGALASMNTVVLKDYPYLVLADVYRIETNNSRIALLKISPDRSAVELAYVNMGTQQAAKFYQGNCNLAGGQN